MYVRIYFCLRRYDSVEIIVGIEESVTLGDVLGGNVSATLEMTAVVKLNVISLSVSLRPCFSLYKTCVPSHVIMKNATFEMAQNCDTQCML